MQIEIKRSHLPNKKYDAVINGRKTIPFGQKGASDFTIHKDEARKQRYLERHKKPKIGKIQKRQDSTVGGSHGKSLH